MSHQAPEFGFIEILTVIPMKEAIAFSEDGERVGELEFELGSLGDRGLKASDSDHVDKGRGWPPFMEMKIIFICDTVLP
jgi:hypothetical protein